MPNIPVPEDMLADAARALGRGDLAGASGLYARALSVRPDLPEAWFNLAWAQRALRQFDTALESYAKAIKHGVTAPEEAHVNRAAILSDHLFRRDEAICEFGEALNRSPDFLPAWLGLGVLHEDVGDIGAARAAYDRALAAAPGNARALARVATLDTLAGAPGKAVAALEQALAAAAVEDRAELLFALGAALDAAGQYPPAFAAIDEANRLAGMAAPQRYDPTAIERLVDRLIAAFPAAVAAASPTRGSGVRPVFICGMFRSGSTLFERMLGRHKGITAGGELEYIPALAHAMPSYPDDIQQLSADRIATLREAYLAELPAGALVTDKRCDNFLHIGLIHTLLPDALIIHTRRQPLDNLLSLYFLHFGDGVSYDTDLAAAAHYYGQYRRLMSHWHRVFPGTIHDVDYDSLVTDPAPVMTGALEFLNIEHDPTCFAPNSATDTIRTASSWQVREVLHARSSGRWRHYSRELAAVTAQLEAAGIDVSRP